LNYAWKTNDVDIWYSYGDPTNNINSFILNLPDSFKELCHFKLYPFVSGGYFGDAYSLHKSDFKQIQEVNSHPYLEILIQWEEQFLISENVWISSSREEIDLIYSIVSIVQKNDEIEYDKLNDNVVTYLSAEQKLRNYTMILQISEVQKIQTAVDNLKKYLISIS
jgi:hypothetical protein